MLWIENGRLINPATNYDKNVNILIDEGKISKITQKTLDETKNEEENCRKNLYRYPAVWILIFLHDNNACLYDRASLCQCNDLGESN